MSSYLLGNEDVVFVTDSTGVVSLVTGLPIASLDLPTLAVLPALVGSDDAIYAPTLTVLGGFATLTPALFDDADVIYSPVLIPGAITLTTAPIGHDDIIHAAAIVRGAVTLLPGLIDDADSFPAPLLAIVVPVSRTLLPGRPVDPDTVYAPAAGIDRFLRPPLVGSGEVIYPAFDIDTVKIGPEKKLRAPFLSVPDVIYPPLFPRSPLVYFDPEAVYATILWNYYSLTAAPPLPSDDSIKNPFLVAVAQPALVPSDDVVLAPGITLFLVPQHVADDDTIPAADVGWQVIAEVTADEDAIYDAYAQSYNDLLPEALTEDDIIDTYPFFLQSLTGGIPVPKPIGLTGSISYPRRLTGSIDTRRHLTGSISPRISSKAKR